MRANDYDGFAAACSADNETNLINGYYERPAMLDLAGDVRGRRVLAAGCGSGPLAAELQARGALVSGCDSSAAMLDLARTRLAEGTDLRVARTGTDRRSHRGAPQHSVSGGGQRNADAEDGREPRSGRPDAD